MKTDTLSKLILAVIAVALVILSVENWHFRLNTVHAAAPSPQQWEYKTISRNLQWKVSTGLTRTTTEMAGLRCFDQDNEVNCGTINNAMGAQGWELVAAYPFSEYANDAGWAGTTSASVLIFKRPK